MTQDAVVTRVLNSAMAEVAVTRGTACGGNCGNCESCMFQSELKVLAKNLIAAKPGEHVVIESSTKKVFKAVALVYVMPLVLFLVAYAVGAALGMSEGVCVALSFAGLMLGAAILVFSQRKNKSNNQISFEIIRRQV